MPRTTAFLGAVAVAFCTVCSLPAVTQSATVIPASLLENIRAERIRARMAFLADDLLEGRGTATRGYLLAARFVASEFESMGLQPAGDNQTFYQNVEYRETLPDMTSSVLEVRNAAGQTRRLMVNREFTSWGDPIHSRVDLTAGTVFVGYGMTIPELGYDDYREADVTGKIAV